MQTNNQALDELLHKAQDLGFVVGIDELIRALRVGLTQIKQGKDIGVRNREGNPVCSLRSFAQAMGERGGGKNHTYLSLFVNDKATPCITVMNQIANILGIQYIFTNSDDQQKPFPISTFPTVSDQINKTIDEQ